MDTHIDTRNPLHAAAYLKAASHFLSGWPQNWSAERLALALVDEYSPDQVEVKLWDTIERSTCYLDDPYLHSDSLINDLAESMIDFAMEHRFEVFVEAVKQKNQESADT